jgi:hypothetical protein
VARVVVGGAADVVVGAIRASAGAVDRAGELPGVVVVEPEATAGGPAGVVGTADGELLCVPVEIEAAELETAEPEAADVEGTAGSGVFAACSPTGALVGTVAVGVVGVVGGVVGWVPVVVGAAGTVAGAAATTRAGGGGAVPPIRGGLTGAGETSPDAPVTGVTRLSYSAAHPSTACP